MIILDSHIIVIANGELEEHDGEDHMHHDNFGGSWTEGRIIINLRQLQESAIITENQDKHTSFMKVGLWRRGVYGFRARKYQLAYSKPNARSGSSTFWILGRPLVWAFNAVCKNDW